MWRRDPATCDRWRAFEYDELARLDRLNLGLLWLKESVLEGRENLPEPNVLAAEIVEGPHVGRGTFQARARELESSIDDMA